MIPVFIILFIAIFLFIATTIFSRLYYKKINKKSYSFLNCFPYELNLNDEGKYNVGLNILFVLSLLFLLGFFVILDMYLTYDKLTIAFIAFVVFIGLFGFSFNLFYGMRNVKTHLLFSSLLFISTLVVLVGIAYFGIYHLFDKNTPEYDIKKIVVGFVSFAIFIFYLALILSKRLRDWAEMEEVHNEDGTINYVRPKVFPLALYEWLFIVGEFISSILVLVAYI